MRFRALLRAALLGLALAASSRARAETVTVFAAASLTESFRTIGKAFEAARPGTTVDFNFAASSTLARQIVEGAPADVFASADEDAMRKVVDAGAAADAPRSFVGNRLAILVPRGNPGHVRDLADLGAAGVTLALAAPAVPAGRYAAEAFARAGVPVPASSNEADVKAVVTRVAMGEADAGIVYVTDVAAAGERVEAVTIPAAHNVVARYPVAVVKGAPSAAAARGFVAYLLSAPAQRVFADAGFVAP